MAWFGSAQSTPVDDPNDPTKAKFHGLAPVPLLPIDTTLAASTATTAAAVAAKKQKAKAGAGGDTLLTAPAPGVAPAPMRPTSLLGS